MERAFLFELTKFFWNRVSLQLVGVFNHLVVGFPLLLKLGWLLLVCNWHNYRLHDKNRFVDHWQRATFPLIGFRRLRLERDCFESLFWHNAGVDSGAASQLLDELAGLTRVESTLRLRRWSRVLCLAVVLWLQCVGLPILPRL